MGCVLSRIDQEERVRVCKDRKRLMKQLLRYRHEFASAQLAYLRSLKNTGATLRQFTESDSLEIEETASDFKFPPSPPPPRPLPPSPPPPPNFSPNLRNFEKRPQSVQEIEEIDETDSDSPPPPIPSSSWEYWDLFASPSLPFQKDSVTLDHEEENWADTYTEFVDEDEEAVFGEVGMKNHILELGDDNLSVTSSQRIEGDDLTMVVWKGKKSLTGIVLDLDEYFLKASAVVKDTAIFIDIDCGGTFTYQSVEDNKGKRSNPAKVFSVLTWSWSSKSLQSTRETGVFSGSGEPCKPGAHCITLEKLYSVEQSLYKDIKEEANAKVEHGRKCELLQRQEEENDWARAEKTHSTVESLVSRISSLHDSITRSNSTILKLINEELYPQLITLASGLMQMWQTMHECHQFQLHISQHLSQLTDHISTEPTTQYHRQAAAQLQTEVTSWYQNFCKLVKFQREYVKAIYKWTELTNCLEDIGNSNNGNSSIVRTICRKWMQALDKLPDKMLSEAINGLSSAIHCIVLQQQEECNMHKRSDKSGRKLERELILLSEMEMKFVGIFSPEEATPITSTKHPLIIKRAKLEALKKIAEDDNAKYLSSVKVTRTMIMNNLRTSLPKVFQALVMYSSAYVQSFEAILSNDSVSVVEETISGI